MANTPVAGTDGVVPVLNLNNLWKTWNITEVYTGGAGASKYIPNLNDYVVDTNTNQYYKVTAVDPVTFVSTLTPIVDISTGEFSATDLLLGVGPGTPSDTYRVYIDKSVIPYVVSVDRRLHVAGSEAMSVQLFTGSQLEGNQQVISAMYDQAGNLLGNSVPLELAAIVGQNVAMKYVPTCYTTANLPDGEVITAVVYSATGNVVSKRQLLVENTAFISSDVLPLKYITSIGLLSPFMSTSDPTTLLYPMNMLVEGLSLMGKVNYSDGSSIELPVDGTKFSLFGLDDLATPIVGSHIPLILKYTLSPGESNYGMTATNQQFVTENFEATIMNVAGAYTVKLYPYPVWIDAINGYRLKWFLYNLDRNLSTDVTPYVVVNPNSQQFNPISYGTVQTLAVSINLQKLNGLYPPYIHAQEVTISLNAPGTDRSKNNWNVGFAPGQNPMYGIGNFAAVTYQSAEVCTANISCGFTTQAQWLQALYYSTLPLTDTVVETAPPVPDSFGIIVNGQPVVFPISQWNVTQTLDTNYTDSDTMFVTFIKTLPQNDLQLSICGLPIYSP